MNIPPKGKIYAVASGKGGVGKTGITLNLATLLTKQGKKVLVFDGDTGLANLDVQLNIKPERDLFDYLTGKFALAHIITATPQGFGLIAGRSGQQGLVNLPLPRLTALLNELRALAEKYDVILLDIAAGVAPQSLLMCAQANATLLVVTPDPSSLTDAYAHIKLMWQDNATANSQLIINQASKLEGSQVHLRLSTAAQQFLGLPQVPLLGIVPSCRSYAQAVRHHQLAAISAPHSPALEALEKIAHKLA